MKIGVIGAGAWGLALAQALCDNGHDVIAYARESERVAAINARHIAPDIFGEHVLPTTLTASDCLQAAIEGRDALLLAVPTEALDCVLEQIKPYLTDGMLLINAAKGFDRRNLLSPMEAMEQILGKRPLPPVAVLGPSHAEEVIARRLTCICAVCEDESVAAQVQHLFSGEYLRLYTCTDTVGAQVGAAVKNVIALAAGMLDGLQLGGDNAKAALVSRGICEILRYGLHCGARRDTFFGLTGVGDLIVTCFSQHSRNYRAGLAIGRADSASAFLASNRETVEGIFSAKVIAEAARAAGIDMPLVEAVYDVLWGGVAPSVAVRTVMMRPLKSE